MKIIAYIILFYYIYSKDKNINLKNFNLSKCKDIELDKDNKKEKKICDEYFKKFSLRPLNYLNYYSNDLFKFIKKWILNPLGYKMDKQIDLYNLLKNIIFLNKKDSIFKNIKPKVLPIIKKKIINDSMKLTLLNKNLNLKKSNLLINKVVKSFRMFWITLRNNNKEKLIKKDTSKLLDQILEFRNKKIENDLTFSKLILSQVKENYLKFLRAKKIWKYIKKNNLDWIIYSVLNRYKSLIMSYKNHKIDNQTVIKEIIIILDLIKTYTLFSKDNNFPFEEIKKMAEVELIDKIKFIFSIFSKYMKNTNYEIYKEVKDFTALIIGKTIHKIKVVLDDIKYKKYITNDNDDEKNLVDSNSMKSYYEWRDNLLQITEICKYYDIINCYKKNFYNITSKIINKYQLFSSTTGLFIEHLIDRFKEIFFSNKNINYFSHINFIKYYYNIYSKLIKKIKSSLKIENLKTIEKLEINIGSLIGEFKKYNLISKLDHSFIDQWDKDLYDYFLELKIQFNSLGDIKGDSKSVNRIKLDLEDFLDNNFEKNIENSNEQLKNLINQIKLLVKKWCYKHSLNYIIKIPNGIKNENKDIEFFNKINNNND